jgi:hypothetical protein
MATGTRKQYSETVIDEKGVPRTVPTADVMAGWGPGGGGFQILEVSEDGRRFQKATATVQDLKEAERKVAQVAKPE